MSEPTRLVDGAIPSDVAALLRLGRTEGPRDAKEKQRRICTAAAASAAWAASAPPPSSSSLRNVAWVGLVSATLVFGSIAVQTLSSSSTAHVVQPSASDVVSASRGEEQREAKTTVAPSAAPIVALTALPSLHVDDLPAAAPSSNVASPQRSQARRATSTNVEDELNTIDAIRTDLSTHRPELALSRIGRYRAVFITPRFADEADTLEVQTLAALGRTEEARAKGERFLEGHPNSPYRQRVRTAAGLRAPAQHD